MSGGLSLLFAAAVAALSAVQARAAQQKVAFTRVVDELEALGLGGPSRRDPQGHTLGGTWCGREVRVRVRWGQAWTGGGAHVELEVLGAAPGLSARPLGGGDPERRPHEAPMGDPDLDAAVALSPERFEALFPVTPQARLALLGLLGRGWTLEQGCLRVRAFWPGAVQHGVASWRTQAIRLMEAWDQGPRTLVARLDAEVNPAPRLALLEALAAYGPDYVRRVLPAAVAQDRQPELAALAAALLGDGVAWDAAPAWGQARAALAAPAAVIEIHRARRDQTALIDTLGRGPSPLLLPAILALGDLGDREAVEPLLALARVRGPPAEAARRAITQIQGRLGGAEPGQVALAALPVEAGGLDLVESAGGLEPAEGA